MNFETVVFFFSFSHYFSSASSVITCYFSFWCEVKVERVLSAKWLEEIIVLTKLYTYSYIDRIEIFRGFNPNHKYSFTLSLHLTLHDRSDRLCRRSTRLSSSGRRYLRWCRGRVRLLWHPLDAIAISSYKFSSHLFPAPPSLPLLDFSLAVRVDVRTAWGEAGRSPTF